MHTHMHTQTHRHTHTQTHTQRHTHINTHTHTLPARARARTHTHTHIRGHVKFVGSKWPFWFTNIKIFTLLFRQWRQWRLVRIQTSLPSPPPPPDPQPRNRKICTGRMELISWLVAGIAQLLCRTNLQLLCTSYATINVYLSYTDTAMLQ